jgi:hypothetical protein
MVRWILQPDSTWDYDYTVFDRYVDSMMQWGITRQISCHSPVGWNSDEIPYWCEREKKVKRLHAPVGSELYAVRWDHFLTSFRAYLIQRGWFDRAVLYLDELDPETLEWVVSFIKANHSEWKIGLAAFNEPPEPVLSKLYDLSMMVGTEVQSGRGAAVDNRTFYTSCNPPHPNTFIAADADPCENIWMGWHAAALGIHGYLRWAYDYWRLKDPYDQRAGGFTSGDFSLLYRSSNQRDMDFFCSIRLELLREGIEDYEKIRVLTEGSGILLTGEEQERYQHLLRVIQAFSIPYDHTPEIRKLVFEARKLLSEFTAKPK